MLFLERVGESQPKQLLKLYLGFKGVVHSVACGILTELNVVIVDQLGQQ